ACRPGGLSGGRPASLPSAGGTTLALRGSPGAAGRRRARRDHQAGAVAGGPGRVRQATARPRVLQEETRSRLGSARGSRDGDGTPELGAGPVARVQAGRAAAGRGALAHAQALALHPDGAVMTQGPLLAAGAVAGPDVGLGAAGGPAVVVVQALAGQ